MAREQILRAKMELAVAYRSFDGTLETAGRILTAENDLRFALADGRADELRGAAVIASALSEWSENLVVAGNASGAILCGVRESERSGSFLAMEAATGDGWTWPVRIMQTGWAHGDVDGSGQPHYFPSEVVAQVAQAADGTRFRRRHPPMGDGSDAPELTAGWLSNARMSGTSALATVNLLKSESEIRSKLMAAREAGKLDLFSVSILAYFGFKRSSVEGKSALVATTLQKFVGLDLCAEPGAGGRFLDSAGAN
jgi:hypothetical protein